MVVHLLDPGGQSDALARALQLQGFAPRNSLL
jgi:hypothetical protein